MDKTRAFQRAIRNYQPGSRALAAQLDMSESTLAHKASPTYPTMFFSPEEGIHFQLETGDHGPLQVEAAALGYVLIKRPHLEGSEVDARAVNNAVREFSDFLSEVTDALADGQVTGNELDRINRECIEAVAAIQDLRARLAALHEAGLPADARSSKRAGQA